MIEVTKVQREVRGRRVPRGPKASQDPRVQLEYKVPSGRKETEVCRDQKETGVPLAPLDPRLMVVHDREGKHHRILKKLLTKWWCREIQ